MKAIGILLLNAALLFALPYALFFIAPSICMEWMWGDAPKPSDVAKFVIWSTRGIYVACVLCILGTTCLLLGGGSKT